MLEADRLNERVEAVRLDLPQRRTVAERIVEFLRDLPLDGLTYMDAWPVESTQQGVADALGISRAHAALELRRCQSRGWVQRMKAHVAGGKAVRTVYRIDPSPLIVHTEAGQPLPLVKGTVTTLKVVVIRCPACGSRSRVALDE